MPVTIETMQRIWMMQACVVSYLHNAALRYMHLYHHVWICLQQLYTRNCTTLEQKR